MKLPEPLELDVSVILNLVPLLDLVDIPQLLHTLS